jgi:hypothetical protein
MNLRAEVKHIIQNTLCMTSLARLDKVGRLTGHGLPLEGIVKLKAAV